jgi:anion-transporting  ArsA/GET3 family ATPase
LGPLNFFSEAHAVIITGKGGTGKTTVSAVMANLAARHGLRAQVVQVGSSSARDGAGPPPDLGVLARLFGADQPLGYEAAVLSSSSAGGEVSARSLAPDTALLEYLSQHGMRRLSRRLVASGALDVVATAVPGMPDMLVLGKVKQMERAAVAGQPGAPGLIILDAPAAGHALRFLQSPRGMLQAAGGGPLQAQAREVVEMLSDPTRCQVVLVTTPDETPVTETIETAQALVETTGTKLGAVVVNALLPFISLPEPLERASVAQAAKAARAGLDAAQVRDLVEAGQLRAQRQGLQATQVARLAQELPLPQLELPFCFSSELGPAQLAQLTAALATALSSWPSRPS